MSNSNGGAPPGGYGGPPSGSGGGGPFGGGYGPPPGAGYGPPPGSSPSGGAYGPPPTLSYGPPPVQPYGAPLPGTPLPPPGYGVPNSAGYTPPPPVANASNPFGQPVPYNMPPPSTFAFAIPPRGSFGLGFAIGLCGACVGLGLVYALSKGPDTKKGAAVGFGVFLALCVLSQLIGALSS